MKSTIFFFIAALAATVAVHAQQIAVVAPGGATTHYTDLNLAIQGAESGSTIYLPGGGFQIADSTKITKKLSIIGVGHRPDNNGEGNTNVSGNFFFEGGSSGSAIMGIHLSGDVNIGTSAEAINNFLLRYCNVNSVQVKNNNCQGVLINQNYLRGTSRGGNSSITFSNNILNSIFETVGGVILHNVVHGNLGYEFGYSGSSQILNCQIINNIFFSNSRWWTTNCVFDSNMATWNLGNNVVVVTSLDDVFIEGRPTIVNSSANYHLKAGTWKTGATDGSEIGIYGGSGFSDSALPPGPRIAASKIGEQTDANGNLPIEIKVEISSGK